MANKAQPPPIEDPFLENDIEKRVSQAWLEFFYTVFRYLTSSNVVYSTVRITDAESPYTILQGSINLVCDTDGGAITVNFPTGSTNDNIRVSNAGSSGNDVTLNGNGSEKIYGLSSQTLFDNEVLNCVFESVEGWR